MYSTCGAKKLKMLIFLKVICRFDFFDTMPFGFSVNIFGSLPSVVKTLSFYGATDNFALFAGASSKDVGFHVGRNTRIQFLMIQIFYVEPGQLNSSGIFRSVVLLGMNLNISCFHYCFYWNLATSLWSRQCKVHLAGFYL